MGVLWSMVYTLLEYFNPGSFNLGNEHIKDNRILFLYYSFVTLTTLGYGDVTPVGGGVRMLAIFEALAGQLYLTLLVARLVGIHIAQSGSRGG